MLCPSLSRWVLASVYLLAACPASAVAHDQPWKVQGKLLGEAEGSGFEKSEDVSGIACAPAATLPRLCLLADDETQGTQIVLLKKSELLAGEFIRLTSAMHGGDPLELDAEGVAYEDGNFYVTGSHGRPRHSDNPEKDKESNAKAAATRQIFRIALAASAVDMTTGRLVALPAITPSSALTGILQSQPEIAPSYDRALADGGLTIEGIAVRDQRLYVGMRSPVIGTDAAVLSVATSAVFGGAPAPSTLHRLALGTDTAGQARGVRDLARYRNGFLVLAGPVQDPPDNTAIRTGDYSIYSWDGENPPTGRHDLQAYGKKAKPEALQPIEGDDGHVRVLLLFDGPKEGAPRSIDVKLK